MTWNERWGGAPGIYEAFADGYGAASRDDPTAEGYAELRLLAATLMRVKRRPIRSRGTGRGRAPPRVLARRGAGRRPGPPSERASRLRVGALGQHGRQDSSA